MLRKYLLPVLAVCFAACTTSQKPEEPNGLYHEEYRNQIHFSPKQKWMNDPNGMVFYKGVYHLFFQHYPDSTVWGPMHWGHATSTDLVHWQEQPIALYPDSLGYIFSGSVVADVNNTSGLGKNGAPPLVAIFTHHKAEGEAAGRMDYQNQSIAYSTDEGMTWTKYTCNPVLKNPGIKDFRDPKVSWYEAGKKWVMTLATKDRITFYSSPNLKDWTKESEFGANVGAHGGVWECPDLFTLDANGKKVWVLLVSINPGGPNGGSATQYFTGDFDGKTFTPYQTDIRWIDYGPDDYAGVTWSNTGDRKIFLGWMSNWQYGTVVPTKDWRSAMTVPRNLSLQQVGDNYFLRSTPVEELNNLNQKTFNAASADSSIYTLPEDAGNVAKPGHLTFTLSKAEDVAITLQNAGGDKVVVGYDKAANQYYFDRTASGNVDFESGFAKRLVAPRISTAPSLSFNLIIDKASVELFADGGLSVMTGIFFTKHPLDKIRIESANGSKIQSLTYTNLKSIWP